ncbi:MAG: phosphatase PAP2 family protein [Cyanobacteria bacterium J06631_9]
MNKFRIYWLAYALSAALLLSLSAAVLLEQVFPLDTAILQAVHQLSNRPVDYVMLVVTRTVNPHFTVPVVFVVFSILWLKRYRLEAYVFALNCLGGVVLSNGLKVFFGKARPAFWESSVIETTYSYPSGHALGSVVLYGFLAYLVGARWPQHRVWGYGSAIALCLAIGFSRLYLGVHWPTDLIGGYLIGLLWTSSCLFLLKHLLKQKRLRKSEAS